MVLLHYDYTILRAFQRQEVENIFIDDYLKKVEVYRLCLKKLYNFLFFFIAEKVNKAQQQHSGGQKHNFPVFKIFKWYHSILRCKSYGPVSDES